MGKLGFAKLITKLLRVRLILKPFDGGKSGFVGRLIAKDCWLVAKRNERGFEDAVGDGGGCLHALKIRRGQRECNSFLRLFYVGGEGACVRGMCVGIK